MHQTSKLHELPELVALRGREIGLPAPRSISPLQMGAQEPSFFRNYLHACEAVPFLYNWNDAQAGKSPLVDAVP